MSNELCPADVLIAIGYYLPERRRYFSSIPIFERFLYQQKLRFPDILDGFLFDTNGHRPVSEEVSSTVSMLVLSGLLEISGNMLNPSYHFSDAVNIAYEGRLRKILSAEQKTDLEKLAAGFNRVVAFDKISL